MLLTYKKPFESNSMTFQIKKRRTPFCWFIFLNFRIPSSLFYNFYPLNMKNFYLNLDIDRVFLITNLFLPGALQTDKLLRINLIISKWVCENFSGTGWIDETVSFHFDETPKPATVCYLMISLLLQSKYCGYWEWGFWCSKIIWEYQ
jgi:hypothetical protein